jgi:hypothetical protein
MFGLAYVPGSRSLMSASIETSTRYYAVISVRSAPHRERLVVAYPDEKSLRGLIAAPSILALGYQSRAEALACMDGVDLATCALPQALRTVLPGALTRGLKRFPAIRAASEVRLALTTTRTMIRHLGRYCFAVAIVFVYSKNLLSATLRALASF